MNEMSLDCPNGASTTEDLCSVLTYTDALADYFCFVDSVSDSGTPFDLDSYDVC